MSIRNKLYLLLLTFGLLGVLPYGLSAQEQQKAPADSLVRLLSAKSAKLKQIDSNSFREIVGPATFLHNNTYLLCDTALWNVSTNIIDAIGNVQIIQDNTTLKSDRIEYLVDFDLAKFRGNLVELYDNEGNILRTNYLDYNTKDSSGVFFNGGVLVNNNGNLIESTRGDYESKENLFTFKDSVEMFTDSTFIKSNKVDYRTDLNIAYLGTNTIAWQGENILAANSGEFLRSQNILIFNKDSYILSPEQELWADELKYFRLLSNAELTNNVQMVDTVQSVLALSDKAIYSSYPMRVELTENPVLGLYSYEEGVRDTLFFRADTINYFSKRLCDIDSIIVAQCNERKKLSLLDPISQIENEAMAMHKRMYERANFDPSKQQPKKDSTKLEVPTAPTLKAPILKSPNLTDSLASNLNNLQDSTAIQIDTTIAQIDTAVVQLDTIAVEVVQDTTSISFIEAYHNVKFYRRDFQGVADSLVYVGIDSIARFYKDPILWNGVDNQFTSDSMQVIIENGSFTKANLLSNAFIASRQDSIYYNQIKSPEMVAYFTKGELSKFDALGGVSAIFYLSKDSIVTEMNQKESKMMQARFKNKEVQRLKYIEGVKNDLHPLFNLPLDKQRLRGFEWKDKERPLSRYSITEKGIKPTQRPYIEDKKYPLYNYAEAYFPNKRDSIFIYKAYLDSMKIDKILNSVEIVIDTATIKIDSLELNAIISNDITLDILGNKLSKEEELTTNISTNEDRLLAKSNRVEAIKSELKDKALLKEQKRELKRERKELKGKIRKLKRETKKLRKELTKLQRKSKK